MPSNFISEIFLKYLPKFEDALCLWSIKFKYGFCNYKRISLNLLITPHLQSVDVIICLLMFLHYSPIFFLLATQLFNICNSLIMFSLFSHAVFQKFLQIAHSYHLFAKSFKRLIRYLIIDLFFSTTTSLHHLMMMMMNADKCCGNCDVISS